MDVTTMQIPWVWEDGRRNATVSWGNNYAYVLESENDPTKCAWAVQQEGFHGAILECGRADDIHAAQQAAETSLRAHASFV